MKFSVELNCAPKQNTRFSSSLQIYKEFMKKDEIFIPRKFKEKNNTTAHRRTGKKIKANLNHRKLKAQAEILEDKTTHYKTKYQEIDQELMTEIRELYPIETQPFFKNYGEKTAKRKKKNQEKSWTKNLHG